MSVKVAPSFQEAIDTVESLSFNDQWVLIELVRKRLIEQNRSLLVAEVAEARQAYQEGNVQRGTVSDLMKELMG